MKYKIFMGLGGGRRFFTPLRCLQLYIAMQPLTTETCSGPLNRARYEIYTTQNATPRWESFHRQTSVSRASSFCRLRPSGTSRNGKKKQLYNVFTAGSRGNGRGEKVKYSLMWVRCRLSSLIVSGGVTKGSFKYQL